MVGSEFLDFANKFRLATYIGVEDFADKLNFLFTVVILLLCTLIITIKQYFMKSIACYIPTVPSGSDFDDYVENYCWVHGTIPLGKQQSTPQDNEWDRIDKTERINYYQWVPFVLGLQCILFYAPRIFWQAFCYNRTGTDLESIITLANQGVHSVGEERKTTVQHIAHTLEDMFVNHREYRHGRMMKVKRAYYHYFKLCMLSKRQGTWLLVCYFIVKLMYIANSIGQLYLMKTFLGFNSSMNNFGLDMLRLISNGQDWRETLYFPRITFCNINNVRQVGATQRYTAQCALPMNMLNEKIYIFLWFWTAMVAFFTVFSLPIWIYRLGMFNNRLQFIKKFLRVSDCYNATVDRETLKCFVKGFLRHDGVFLIRMMSLNTGDLITNEVVSCLWNLYNKNYEKNDLRKYHDDDEHCLPLQKLSYEKDDQMTLPLGPTKQAKNFQKSKLSDPTLDSEEGDLV